MQYSVPQSLSGMSLQDITKKYGGNFDILGKMFGISPQTPLTSGQTLTYRDVPGINFSSSTEGQLISKYFKTGVSPQPTPTTPTTQAFQEEERGRLEEFTGKLGEIPEQLAAVRQALKLPEAYQTYGTAGETARQLGYQVTDLPTQTEEMMKQATKGYDVSANQLSRMIASKTLEGTKALTPALTEAERGLEAAGSTLSGLLSQYGIQTDQIFTPYQIEANLLGTSISEEFGLYKQEIKNALDKEIAQMQEQGATDRENIKRAIAMAELEQATQEGLIVDLGDRTALINPYTATVMAGWQKGKLGTLQADVWKIGTS